MDTKYAPLEAALRQIRDEMNAALASAPPKFRPRLELGREQVGNAIVQMELLMLMSGESPTDGGSDD